MASIVTPITGSLLGPQYKEITLYGTADQTIRLTLRPFPAAGIAGQSYVFTLKKGTDAASALQVSGNITDPINCQIDFLLSANLMAGLFGRYTLDIRQTTAANDGPVIYGSASVVGAVGP